MISRISAFDRPKATANFRRAMLARSRPYMSAPASSRPAAIRDPKVEKAETSAPTGAALSIIVAPPPPTPPVSPIDQVDPGMHLQSQSSSTTRHSRNESCSHRHWSGQFSATHRSYDSQKDSSQSIVAPSPFSPPSSPPPPPPTSFSALISSQVS